jgi:HEAT repeat protein
MIVSRIARLWTSSPWQGACLSVVCLLVLPLNVLAQATPEPPATAPTDVPGLTADLRSDAVIKRRAAAIAVRERILEHREQFLPVLIERLQSERDGQVRYAVLEALTDLGPLAEPAVPALLASLREDFGHRGHEERHQHYRVAIALSAIGPAAVAGLSELLDAEDEGIRGEVAMALGRIGNAASPAVERLGRRLRDSSERVRLEAGGALGRIGPAATDTLLRGEKSNVLGERLAAIHGIGCSKVDDPRLTEALLHAAADAEPAIRAASIGAMADHQPPNAQWHELVRQALADREEAVRLAAINQVVRQPDSLQALQSALEALLADQDAGVAGHAAFLFQHAGNDAALRMLDLAPDPRTRLEQLAQNLASRGSGVQPALVAALQDAEPRRREVAVLALGQMRPLSMEVVEQVVRLLDDPQASVQRAALLAVKSLGPRGAPALPKIRERAHDPDPQVREATIEILFASAPRDEQLIEALAIAVDDGEPSVQRRAIELLRATGPLALSSLPRVTSKLTSEHQEVRLAAVETLADFGRGAEPSIPDLLKALEASKPEEDEWQGALIEALGRIGPPAAEAYERLVGFLNAGDPKLRMTALEALGNLELEPSRLVPVLERLLEDEQKDVREQALRQIRKLGNDSGLMIPALIRFVARGDDVGGAVRALERLEKQSIPKETMERLIELLDDDAPQVRRETIKFLGRLGRASVPALAKLEQLRAISTPNVQAAIDTALQQIHDATAPQGE